MGGGRAGGGGAGRLAARNPELIYSNHSCQRAKAINIIAARAEIAFDRIGYDFLQGLGKANYAR